MASSKATWRIRKRLSNCGIEFSFELGLMCITGQIIDNLKESIYQILSVYGNQ
jgi:hypothetical protein